MDLLSSVEKVVKIALEIKEQVKTVRKNKEGCENIATSVERLRAIVDSFGKNPVAREETMMNTLNDLEKTFLQALNLIKACQTKNRAMRFIMARSISKELFDVRAEIMERVATITVNSNLKTTAMVFNLFMKNEADNPKKLLKVTSMQGEQEIHVGDSRLQPPYICDAVPEVDNAYDNSSAHFNRLSFLDLEIQLKNRASMKGSFQAGSLEDAIYGLINFRSSELKVLTDNFSHQRVIGQGGFAIVYKGVLPNGTEVAIKSFHNGIRAMNDDPVAKYGKVFSVLREHENVIRLLGYCEEEKMEFLVHEGKCVAVHDTHRFIVEEYMPNGNLSELDDVPDWSSVFRIIRGIAHGVAHIHRKGAVHLDLKPANILLDSHMNPKICDFQSSMILNERHDEGVDEIVTRELVGTLGFIPPEYIANGIISLKNDVYSFGILLLRTICQLLLLQDSIDWIWEALAVEGNVYSLLDSSSRNEAELNEIKRCMDIGLQCASQERTDRPTMLEVVEMLDGKEQPRKTPVLRNKASSFKKKGRA